MSEHLVLCTGVFRIAMLVASGPLPALNRLATVRCLLRRPYRHRRTCGRTLRMTRVIRCVLHWPTPSDWRPVPSGGGWDQAFCPCGQSADRRRPSGGSETVLRGWSWWFACRTSPVCHPPLRGRENDLPGGVPLAASAVRPVVPGGTFGAGFPILLRASPPLFRLQNFLRISGDYPLILRPFAPFR
jgi:hypothetical protein